MKKSLTFILASATVIGLLSAAMAQQDAGQNPGQGNRQGNRQQMGQGMRQGQNRNNNMMGRGFGYSSSVKLGTTGVYIIQSTNMVKLNPDTLKPVGQLTILPAELTGGQRTNSQRVPAPGEAPAAPTGFGMMIPVSAEIGANDALYCVAGPYYVHIDGTTMKEVARFALIEVPQPQQPDSNAQPDAAPNPQMGQAMQAMMMPSQLQLKGNKLLISMGNRVFLVDTSTDKVVAAYPEQAQ